MTTTEAEKLNRGDVLIYNDGREGHINVSAEVINATADFMVLQFQDRASPTTVFFNSREWMDHLTAA